MVPVRVKPDRAMQVEACLATVMDPELDEPVTELGFVTGLEVDGGEVRIAFRLPTYWCAANFAFLMADDMRLAVQALPWVTNVRVQLHEHMYADAINSGVAAGHGFEAAFGAAAEGGLDELRRTFLRKAFQRRQQALLEHLLDGGHAAADLVALDAAALPGLVLDDPEGERRVERYLERRTVAGGGALAFVDVHGQPLEARTLARYMHKLQGVSVNTEFNGALCRGLLAARYAQTEPQPIAIVRRTPQAPPG